MTSGLVFGILYFVFKNWFIKAVPIWFFMIATTFKYPTTNHSKAIAIGLFFSSIGDVSLAWVDYYHMEEFFIVGLGAFLIAHLAYIYGTFEPIQKKAFYSLPVLLIYYYTVMSKLIPNAEPELRIPVLVYGLAICTMGFTAINRMLSDHIDSKSGLLGFLGALSFVVSDTILAFNKFYSPIPSAHVFVMITYYLAQLLITSSVLAMPIKAKKSE